jgi:hypothetical protein
MLRTKPDVRFEVITPALLRMLTVLEYLARTKKGLNSFIPTEGIVITSGSEGKHKPNSLHYKGLAIDIRSRTFTIVMTIDFLAELRKLLGSGFQVIEEHNPPHFHIEYDPKP